MDWSEVEWSIYTSPEGTRVMERKLSAKEMRPGEEYAATVVGVSRKTVLAHLKAGVDPARIQAKVCEATEAQAKRVAESSKRNHYLEWLAAAKKRREEEAAA